MPGSDPILYIWRYINMDEKSKWMNKGKLMAYVDDCVVLEPPCYNEMIFDIWYSYIHTGYSKNKETPIVKLTTDFPEIDMKDIKDLVQYFKEVKDFCVSVCCAFAGIYDTVVIPTTVDAQKDILYVVKACQKRYPWLKEEFIVKYLRGVTAMCNR